LNTKNHTACFKVKVSLFVIQEEASNSKLAYKFGVTQLLFTR